jgi:hypothetical protein
MLQYPDTTWLTITNVALGLLTFAAIAAVAWGIWMDVRSRAALKAPVRQPRREDDHTFAIGELGLTMADGGVKENRIERPLNLRATDELEE